MRLHPLVSTQNLLHHGLHVVVAQSLENTPEVDEGTFVGLKQSLFLKSIPTVSIFIDNLLVHHFYPAGLKATGHSIALARH
jgi:hypothetical protein